MDVPDPGAYDVLKAFKANRDKCDYCRRLHAPFGSRDRRFPKLLREEDITRPDGTTYEVAGDIARNVTGGVMLLPREDPKRNQVPGPAHYCLHPYVSSSVLKKSFNSSLSKPKMIAALEKVEKEALQPGCRCTKKKLRCFAEPEDKYKHCSPSRTRL
ncbi:uncharacterized protein LOC143209259 [Lasioglossum baleicum]|uniref:uncharacterized protein LOC143209259 n=1 Tax=Lasioglossum baleicum TaxID=434251 RepID=UPI003FCE197F